MADKADIIVICGPTATGKTALSVALAKLLDGEVVSADSMQIYKGLRVGTAQAAPEEMKGVPHHLVGFLPPEERFSVADYVRHAGECIAQITARGRVPIVAGGTGLYISSLVNGIDFTPDKADPAVRARLETELMEQGVGPLYARLQQVDPECAAKLHPNNHGRVLRALELYEQTGETMSCRLARSRPAQQPYRALLIGLNMPERAQLYARIDARDAMFAHGLLEEARLVYANEMLLYRGAGHWLQRIFPYFEGKEPLENMALAGPVTTPNGSYWSGDGRFGLQTQGFLEARRRRPAWAACEEKLRRSNME
ncbi:MAG: tRNA (adenosine(37)-N6)-dimethylallyltransferase MiaA [Ruthenibacterium lactatiformans]